MLKLITLSILQAAFLSGGQVLLKVALTHMEKASWTWHYVLHSWILNGWLALTGAAFAGAGVLWMYLLKHYPFSVAYPLSSMAYVFGMIAAMLVFKETVRLTHWIGVLLIMAGCVFITR